MIGSKQKMDSKRGTLFRVAPDDYKTEIRLITDPKHPLFNRSAVKPPTPRFLATIEIHGVLEPIKVAESPDERGARGERVYYVVFGRRRYIAWKLANKRRAEKGLDLFDLPCLALHGVVDGTQAPLDAIAQMCAENIHTQDTALETAEKVAALMNARDDVAYAAASSGLTVAGVRQHLLLLQAPAAIQKRVDAGEISLTAGLELAKLSGDALKVALAEVDKASEPAAPAAGEPVTEPKKDGRKKSKVSVREAKHAVARANGKSVAEFRAPSQARLANVLETFAGENTSFARQAVSLTLEFALGICPIDRFFDQILKLEGALIQAGVVMPEAEKKTEPTQASA